VDVDVLETGLSAAAVAVDVLDIGLSAAAAAVDDALDMRSADSDEQHDPRSSSS